MVLIAMVLAGISYAAATPLVSFPFNSQVPPLAQVGQPYLFTFSPTTFTSDGSILRYSLEDAPAWLSLDSSSRTLKGTPGSADTGAPKFSLIARDSTGSVSTQATLIVNAAANTNIQTNADVASVLAQGGPLSSLTELTVLPRAPFAFGFPNGTFTSSSGDLEYYSTLEDHTPLPSWLLFSPSNLSFSGTAPLLSSSPQRFNVLLIGSNVPGFAAASVSFTIVVSVHKFHFDVAVQRISLEPGKAMTIGPLRPKLLLDGKPLADADFSHVSTDAPSWLTLDSTSLTLSGTTPSDFSRQDISLMVSDRFGNTANTTLRLHNATVLLADSFPILTAVSGEYFQYAFQNSLLDQSNLKVTMDLGSARPWLAFNESNMTLSGNIPSNAAATSINMQFIATTADGSTKNTRPVQLQVQKASVTSKTISTRSNSSTSSATGGVFDATGTPRNTETKTTLHVVIGIVVAIIVLIVAVVVLMVWCKSPKRQLRRSRSAMKKNISRPVYSEDNPWTAEIVEENDLEKGSNEMERSDSLPPRVELKGSPFKRLRSSAPHAKYSRTILPVPPEDMVARAHARGQSVASSTIDGEDARILDCTNRSSWGYMGVRRPHDSMKLTADMARQSEISRQSRLADQHSMLENRRISRLSNATRSSLHPVYRSGSLRIRNGGRVVSGGIPVKPRMIGCGHGRSPSNRNSRELLAVATQQNQTPSYADSVTTQFTSVLISPRTPGSGQYMQRTPSASGPRPQRTPSYLDLKRRATLDLSTPEYYRRSVTRPVERRGAHRSAFFSAGHSSRGSSSSRHRNTMLGLSTIHASPNPEDDAASGAGNTETHSESGFTLGTTSAHNKSKSADSYRPLRRNPTKASERTNSTWQTATTQDAGSDYSVAQDAPVAPPVPARHPAHKRWSSQYRARFHRPTSEAGIRESSLFASADEDDSGDEPIQPTSTGAGLSHAQSRTGDSDSSYSQTSTSCRGSSIFHSATPSPEHEPVAPPPPVHVQRISKVPIGGVRLPPFSDAYSLPALSQLKRGGGRGGRGSIMDRPHPRVEIRNASASSNAHASPNAQAVRVGGLGPERLPLRCIRGRENRLSPGLGATGDGLGSELGLGIGLGKAARRPPLKSVPSNRPVGAVQAGVRSVKGSLGGQSVGGGYVGSGEIGERMVSGSPARGDECFL